jgi:hypothetical protein
MLPTLDQEYLQVVKTTDGRPPLQIAKGQFRQAVKEQA